MKPPTSFARSISHLTSVSSSASRIPHLKVHILRRQRAKLCTSSTRLYHAPSLEAPPYTPFEGSHLTGDQTETSRDVVTKSRDLGYGFFDNQTTDLQASAHDQVVTAESLLEDAIPERTLAWLAHHPDGLTFIDTASSEAFEQLFCSIDPEPIVRPFKESASSSRYLLMQRGDFVEHSRSAVPRLRTLFYTVEGILRQRRVDGKPLTLAVCRHTLKCAAAAGAAKAATRIFQGLMREADIDPDVQCHNYLMEAKVWNLAYSEAAVRTQAVTKHLHELRSEVPRPKALRGYAVSHQDPEPDFTLRGQVLRIFQTISVQGLQSTEETFTNLMLGLAKAADITGVESILKSVWNIDAAALERFDEEEIESPTFYEDHHPLRPSKRLLFAIVYAYGINQLHHKAWQILDYTSRSYAMDIPPFVWDELLNWTYANTRRKSAVRKSQGQTADRAAKAVVEDLFRMAIDAPHNLQPTTRMLDLLARSLRDRHDRDGCLALIREMRDRSVVLVNLIKEMISIALAMQRHPSSVFHDGMPSKDFFAFRRDFLSAFLQTLTQLGMCRRHVTAFLYGTPWTQWSGNIDGRRVWTTQLAQRVVEEFSDYLPRYIQYRTETGVVAVHLSKPPKTSPWHVLAQASILWNAISTENPKLMIENLVAMPADLSAAADEQIALQRAAYQDKLTAEMERLSADSDDPDDDPSDDPSTDVERPFTPFMGD